MVSLLHLACLASIAFVSACTLVNVIFQIPGASYDIRVDYYKVDTTKNLVINTVRPRFSWKLSTSGAEENVQQTSYQLQIKSRKDRWDSQRVMSDKSIHLFYMELSDLQPTTFYRFHLQI